MKKNKKKHPFSYPEMKKVLCPHCGLANCDCYYEEFKTDPETDAKSGNPDWW